MPLKGCGSLEAPQPIADQIDGLGAAVVDVGPGGVEVGVAKHQIAGPDQQLHQDVLGAPPLMGRDGVGEAGDLLHGLLKGREAARPNIRFIAPHERRPLLVAHRAGAAVRPEIDEDVLGGQKEHRIERLVQNPHPVGARAQVDPLNALGAKGLSQRLRQAIEVGILVGHGWCGSQIPGEGVSSAEGSCRRFCRSSAA